MKVEIDCKAHPDGVESKSVIKLVPENNREMRDLEYLHQKYGAAFFKQFVDDARIHYDVVFNAGQRGRGNEVT